MGGGDTAGEETILWESHDEGDCIIWRYWYVQVCNKGWETTLFFGRSIDKRDCKI